MSRPALVLGVLAVPLARAAWRRTERQRSAALCLLLLASGHLG